MTAARYIIGDVFDVMSGLPDNSVDLVLTSPPFLALRSYLPDDHPNKDKEIGSETTPAEFIDTLLALTAEWERLLAPHGSICVELGDTYSSSGGITDTRDSTSGGNDLAPRAGRGGGEGWPLAKSLAGIPHLYHLSLAYGRNILTGEPSPAGMWRVRNVVAWVRPNPPVGALGDKFRPATSYLTIAAKASDRWFDLDAVRGEMPAEQHSGFIHKPNGRTDRNDWGRERSPVTAGPPPLDWWQINPKPYKGSHYATFPAELCQKPIQTMCPREVCEQCGEPRRRISEVEGLGGANFLKDRDRATGLVGARKPMPTITRTTTGWTECGCDTPTYRAGVVLDPFAGSGTALAVATGYGRDAIGIDVDERNADLAAERVGMFLTTEQAPA